MNRQAQDARDDHNEIACPTTAGIAQVIAVHSRQAATAVAIGTSYRPRDCGADSDACR